MKINVTLEEIFPELPELPGFSGRHSPVTQTAAHFNGKEIELASKML